MAASLNSDKKVDSYKYLDPITRRMCKSWISLETPRPIPWTPLVKPLGQCKIAMITSAGIALKSDRPFDQESERINPWWGDPSFRQIPRDTHSDDIKVYHLHIDPSYAQQDINSVLPIHRLAELEAAGVVGSCAQTHYSVMGYILQPQEFLEVTAPAIIRQLQTEQVDVVLLFPA